HQRGAPHREGEGDRHREGGGLHLLHPRHAGGAGQAAAERRERRHHHHRLQPDAPAAQRGQRREAGRSTLPASRAREAAAGGGGRGGGGRPLGVHGVAEAAVQPDVASLTRPVAAGGAAGTGWTAGGAATASPRFCADARQRLNAKYPATAATITAMTAICPSRIFFVISSSSLPK